MAIVAQTSVWLGSPIGFVVAAFISIMNFADCFPAEDSRYFELARQRASSGFAISTMTIQGKGVLCLVEKQGKLCDICDSYPN